MRLGACSAANGRRRSCNRNKSIDASSLNDLTKLEHGLRVVHMYIRPLEKLCAGSRAGGPYPRRNMVSTQGDAAAESIGYVREGVQSLLLTANFLHVDTALTVLVNTFWSTLHRNDKAKPHRRTHYTYRLTNGCGACVYRLLLQLTTRHLDGLFDPVTALPTRACRFHDLLISM
jgi:hypothetical protein